MKRIDLLRNVRASFVLLIMCVFLFVSCFESVSDNGKSRNFFHIAGEVNVEGAEARAAIPSYNAENLLYCFTAVEKDNNVESRTVSSSNGTFLMELQEGKWRITCDVYACDSEESKSDTNKILTGTYPEESEPEFVLEDGTEYNKNISFIVKPFVSDAGTGKASLPLKVDNTSVIKSCRAVWKENGVEKYQAIDLQGDGFVSTFNFNNTSVPAGYYVVKLEFYDGPVSGGFVSGQIVCVTRQIVNVFNSLTTDVWKPDASNAYLDSSSGETVFTVKKEHIAIMNRAKFYVDGSLSDEESGEFGTENSPFNTVGKAFAYLRNYGIEKVTVFVKYGTLTNESALEIDTVFSELTLDAYGDSTLAKPVISASSGIEKLLVGKNPYASVKVNNLCFSGNTSCEKLIDCEKGRFIFNDVELNGKNQNGIGIVTYENVEFTGSTKISGFESGLQPHNPVTLNNYEFSDNKNGILLSSDSAQVTLQNGTITSSSSDYHSILVADANSEAVILKGNISLNKEITLVNSSDKSYTISLQEGFSSDSDINITYSEYYFSKGQQLLSGNEAVVASAFEKFKIENWQVAPNGRVYEVSEKLIYVGSSSAAGAPDMDGTYLRPYKNLKDAASYIKSKSGSEYTIYIISDLEATDDSFIGGDSAGFYFDLDLSAADRSVSINIEPVDMDEGQKKINLARNKDNPGRFMKASGSSATSKVEVNLKNLVLTNGYCSGEYRESAVFAGDYSTVVLSNCEFENFTTDSGYRVAEIGVYNTGSVTLFQTNVKNVCMTNGAINLYEDSYVERYDLYHASTYITVCMPQSFSEKSNICYHEAVSEGTTVLRGIGTASDLSDTVKKFVLIEDTGAESSLYKIELSSTNSSVAVIKEKNANGASGEIISCLSNGVSFTVDAISLQAVTYGSSREIEFGYMILSQDEVDFGLSVTLRCGETEIPVSDNGITYWTYTQDDLTKTVKINISDKLPPGTYYIDFSGPIISKNDNTKRSDYDASFTIEVIFE